MIKLKKQQLKKLARQQLAAIRSKKIEKTKAETADEEGNRYYTIIEDHQFFSGKDSDEVLNSDCASYVGERPNKK